jgi:hypothetical protein
MRPSRGGASTSKQRRRPVAGPLLEQPDAAPQQVVPDMIRRLVIDAAWRAGARQFDRQLADAFFGYATAPGDALGGESIQVASLEIHQAINARRVEP